MNLVLFLFDRWEKQNRNWDLHGQEAQRGAARRCVWSCPLQNTSPKPLASLAPTCQLLHFVDLTLNPATFSWVLSVEKIEIRRPGTHVSFGLESSTHPSVVSDHLWVASGWTLLPETRTLVSGTRAGIGSWLSTEQNSGPPGSFCVSYSCPLIHFLLDFFLLKLSPIKPIWLTYLVTFEKHE